MLRAWKTAQTLVEQASGIATAARRIVDAAHAVVPGIPVECTRKAMPGGRALSVRAVLAGGAGMHRLGLSESILIFPEHAALVGGWTALAQRLPLLRQTQPCRRIMVEAKTVADAVALAKAGADVVQVDKLAPEQVREIVERTRGLDPPPAASTSTTPQPMRRPVAPPGHLRALLGAARRYQGDHRSGTLDPLLRSFEVRYWTVSFSSPFRLSRRSARRRRQRRTVSDAA